MFYAFKYLSLLGLLGCADAAAVPGNDGFPKPNEDQKVALAAQAGGKLPNVALPTELGPESTTAFQLIAFNELFETAYFDSLLQNITNVGEHVLAAQTALTSANASFVPSACEYMFPTTNLTQAANIAETFTAVVLGALRGANVLFAKENVSVPIQLISSVIGQEGEQNGYYRQVLKEAPLPIFPPLMTNGQPVAALEAKDQKLSFSADLSKSEAAKRYTGSDGEYLFLIYTTGQRKPVPMEISNVKWDGMMTNFEAEFPFTENVMNGFSHAALTTGNVFESADDLTHCTLAGPGIIQVENATVVAK
ncbi:hypothetical protein NLG97_g5857 [Lecanicillium saksenae]|uniref:Uncharacterized protein n=1 Tax=Lecanicillium saksenae TaxID=468837 RepID=A0ACC1QSY8_9HYPO|nr:hypothetical protein NLG97_g5857 [Lecanicillium saksenae]